ncbi:MAG: metallophosphoesterase, partial [Planctomycetota bacterium]
APVALLALVLLGEVRRLWIRRSCAAARPVDTIPHHVDITNPVTTTDFVVHKYEVPHPKWRGAPLRIVHLTDLHVHPNLPLEYYQEVLSVAEETEPDVAVFTGDFITRAGALPMLRKILRPIAKRESYAVLGNHDYWAKPEAVGKVIAESGLRLLSGESHTLAVGDSEIAFTGYDYPWGTKQKSVPPHESGKLHVVLSHTPDNIYRISKSSADLVFCGHYHAGQIRLPILGPIVVPSVYGRRFDHGHFVVNGTHLFVASGIGAVYPPVRIYCQPDIFVVDIVPA